MVGGLWGQEGRRGARRDSCRAARVQRGQRRATTSSARRPASVRPPGIFNQPGFSKSITESDASSLALMCGLPKGFKLPDMSFSNSNSNVQVCVAVCAWMMTRAPRACPPSPPARLGPSLPSSCPPQRASTATRGRCAHQSLCPSRLSCRPRTAPSVAQRAATPRASAAPRAAASPRPAATSGATVISTRWRATLGSISTPLPAASRELSYPRATTEQMAAETGGRGARAASLPCLPPADADPAAGADVTHQLAAIPSPSHRVPVPRVERCQGAVVHRPNSARRCRLDRTDFLYSAWLRQCHRQARLLFCCQARCKKRVQIGVYTDMLVSSASAPRKYGRGHRRSCTLWVAAPSPKHDMPARGRACTGGCCLRVGAQMQGEKRW